MTDTNAVPVFTGPSPEVRIIADDRPWAWLEAGFADLKRAWPVSMAYGAIVVAFSWALVLVMTGTGHFYLILPMCAGFMLVAPLAAVGLYDTSRRLAAGEPVSLGQALRAFLVNPRHIAYMGLVLALFLLFWIRIATLLYAIFFSDLNPNLANLVNVVFTSDVSLPFLIVGTVLGGVLALLVFAIGAVSVPMLLNRDMNVFTAILTSITAVRMNPKPMLLWAFIIVFCAGVGMATLFVGLAVALPLIGHATWHAYRDLVAKD